MRRNCSTRIFVGGCILMLSIFLFAMAAHTQLVPPFYFPFSPLYSQNGFFASPYAPFLPAYPSFPIIASPFMNPLVNPALASLPTLSRGAAATLVVVPQTTPTVSAYAPLGTLNLTPSTLVFLILIFTLEG
ncbi:MAG: hypothetical protein ACMUIL_13635 [bacterium]